jgi:LysM repeat protein
MNTNPSNPKSPDEDKTIVFNKVTEKPLQSSDDRTQIQMQPEKTGHSSSKEETLPSPKAESIGDGESLKKTIGKSSAKSKGVSKEGFIGGVAGGVAGGAAAGMAAGTIYSDEIKEFFTPDVSDKGDDLEGVEEIEEIDPLMIEDSVIQEGSEIHFEYSGSEGYFEVSMLDTSLDGDFDYLSMEAELVDGSTISFEVSGPILNDLFAGGDGSLANVEDYLSEINGVFEGFSTDSIGAVDYQIEYGDTLSEIAASHNTTIESIMELNPQITDPNFILAGDSLIIPTEEFSSNPYAGWNPNWNVHNILGDNSSNFLTDTSETSEFETMDWDSFEDQSDDYSNQLSNENFMSYDAPDSYFDNYNDVDSLGFI